MIYKIIIFYYFLFYLKDLKHSYSLHIHCSQSISDLKVFNKTFFPVVLFTLNLILPFNWWSTWKAEIFTELALAKGEMRSHEYFETLQSPDLTSALHLIEWIVNCSLSMTLSGQWHIRLIQNILRFCEDDLMEARQRSTCNVCCSERDCLCWLRSLAQTACRKSPLLRFICEIMVAIMRKANHFWQSASKSTHKINMQSYYIWVSDVTLILYLSRLFKNS